ncbi:hypothetical protein BDZ89DRAFT_530776 [Hymenopellis radicata]|nr:hypothetical protein BDZ89DRAFT_530776 [Hymenopellis radicata]
MNGFEGGYHPLTRELADSSRLTPSRTPTRIESAADRLWSMSTPSMDRKSHSSMTLIITNVCISYYGGCLIVDYLFLICYFSAISFINMF